MKFAKYWSEISIAVDEAIFGTNKLSAWGASNEDAEHANVKAQERATILSQLISRGVDALREYEYWNGYIREEVLDEITSGDGRVLAVLTRNCYGAIVLNTESVLFGDIDVVEPGFLAKIFQLLGKTKKDKAFFVSKIEQYQKQNPQYTIKVYETFAGLRVVVTNQIFENYSASAKAIFSALGADRSFSPLSASTASKYTSRLRLTESANLTSSWLKPPTRTAWDTSVPALTKSPVKRLAAPSPIKPKFAA